jgi:hypothetical protein
MKLSNNQYSILERLEEINKPISFDVLSKDLKKKGIKLLAKNPLSKSQLVKFKLITVELIKKKEVYTITEEGKRALIQRPSETANDSQNKEKGKETTLPSTTNKNSLDSKDSQQKEANWLEWTTPIWVEESNQWEFYKKQDGQIIEIFYSQDEEEITTRHKSKVMEHIMAAMQTPKTEEEKKRSRHPVKYNLKEETKKSLDNPTTGRGSQRVGDSSIYLHLGAKHRLLEMKLQGYPQPEILMTVAREFNLKSITVGLYLSEVIKEIRERSRGIVEETLRTHLDRYELMFKWFRGNGYAKMALKALERKEKLVGLHDNEKVDKTVLASLEQTGHGKSGLYDWSLLTEDEYKRLMTLVKRTVIILKPLESTEEK